MKKNIQINLFGTLYNIDDDAYKLLEHYLDSMKSYFSRQEGGEEIADDIEHRVAELLWQRKQQGMEAVGIDTIKEIISQIGNPQEIDDRAEEGATRTDNNAKYNGTAASSEEGNHEDRASFMDEVKFNVKKRRFYRDPTDKMVGGVCSGLAQYVGKGDVTLWRLAFVILPFILEPIVGSLGMFMRTTNITPTDIWFLPGGFWLLPIAYIVLCMVVPEARTAEDKLRMKGAEVTPENINAQVISDTNTDNAPQQRNTGGGGCLKTLFVLLVLAMLMPVFFVVILVLFVIVVAIVCTIGGLGIGLPFVLSASDFGLSSSYFSDYGWLTVTGGIAALLVVAIPIYMIIKRIFGSGGSHRSSLVLVIAWLLMLVWMIVSLVVCGSSFQNYINRSDIGFLSPDSVQVNPRDTIPVMEEIEDTAAIDLRSDE